ncbi:MAG TPA: hypothetical protein ENJ07_02755 [Gammaproteobacteria bacterium]|nr:hypothetical protein [Gammaproteobacteria bacterium]
MSFCDAVGSNGVDQHKKVKLIKFVMSHQRFSIRQALVASDMSVDEFSKIKWFMFCFDDSLTQLNDLDEERTWRLSAVAIDDYREYLDAKEFKKAAQGASVIIRGVMTASFIMIAGALLYSISG